VQLQVVEKQEHVAGGHQRPRRNLPRQAAQRDQELVEKGGWPAVGQLVGHAGKELADGRAMGQAPAIPARMEDQGAPLGNSGGRPLGGARLAIQPGQHAQRGPPAAGPQALRVGHDQKTRL